jgi:UDP-GlcNAc:undecaprenyl-phosphate/decaprenyl-phosphate GlcNAc-1-phosphate transferase
VLAHKIALVVAAMALTWLVMRLAERFHWGFDKIDGVQRFHRHAVTRLGGVALMLGLGAWLLAESSAAWLVCLVPGFLAGLAEDLTGRMGTWFRLGMTACGAVLAWSLLDAQVVRLGPALVDDVLAHAPLLSLVLTALFVTGAAHAVNIVDGYNGLAAGYAVLVCLAVALVAGLLGDAPLESLALGTALVTVGFLAWNFPRGRIFLGDGGAYALGTMVAALVVRLVRDHDAVSPMFAALLMIYPVWETLFSMYRKIVLRHGSAMEPDGLHLHMLVYKRLLRRNPRAVSVDGEVLLNSATALYLAPLVLLSLVPAVLFWQNGSVLAVALVLFVAAYQQLYRRLVRFGLPRLSRLRCGQLAQVRATRTLPPLNLPVR